MSWRNLLASIFGDFCGGSNCPGVMPTIPAKKADAREFQDCYCARIGLCWAPSSRMIDRISPTIRNEPVTRIQPRHRANADARITALRGCESSSAARSVLQRRGEAHQKPMMGAGGRSRADDHIHTMLSEEIKHFERLLITPGSEHNNTEPRQFANSV
jgi:hypothetical protein